MKKLKKFFDGAIVLWSTDGHGFFHCFVALCLIWAGFLLLSTSFIFLLAIPVGLWYGAIGILFALSGMSEGVG